MTPFVMRKLNRLALGRVVQGNPVSLVHTKVMDRFVTFCTNMENDPIQRNHRRGTFYELKELKTLMAIFPKGGIFVDIGANIGNHSLFAALFLEPSKVIPFEPNPKCIEVLIENVVVNHLMDMFDLSNLGIGLSDKASGGYAMEKRTRNLGAAKMLEGQGDLEVHRADEILKGVKPAMIKIDVEGMEMAVLDGLSGLLKRNKPILLVEVDNENEEAFMEWVKSSGYKLVNTHQRYKLNKNHILVAKSKASKAIKAIEDMENAENQ